MVLEAEVSGHHKWDDVKKTRPELLLELEAARARIADLESFLMVLWGEYTRPTVDLLSKQTADQLGALVATLPSEPHTTPHIPHPGPHTITPNYTTLPSPTSD